jgi:hypothetical protein
LIHITELSQNADYAKTIPDDITSALTYPGKRHQIYLLLRYAGEYAWIVYDIKNKQLIDLKEDALLETIRCTSGMVSAGIDPHVIEQHAQDARILWMKQANIEHPEVVERICALYLLPDTPHIAGFETLLSRA